MPIILLWHVVALALYTGPSDQGVGLARRPADQDRVVEVVLQPQDRAVDGLAGCLCAEFKAARLLICHPPRFHIEPGPAGLWDEPGVEVDELFWQRMVTCPIFPQKCAQGQGAMRRRILLN